MTDRSTSSRPTTRRIIADEKALEFDRAPFGIVGLETAVPLCFDRLVHAGLIGAGAARGVALARTRRACSACPAARWPRADRPTSPMLAPDASVTVRAAAFKSKSRNTPFDGWTLKGAVAATIVGGRVVYVNDAVSWPDDSARRDARERSMHQEH